MKNNMSHHVLGIVGKPSMSRGVPRWFIMFRFHVQELLNIEKKNVIGNS
jgi:hypothetical protein